MTFGRAMVGVVRSGGVTVPRCYSGTGLQVRPMLGIRLSRQVSRLYRWQEEDQRRSSGQAEIVEISKPTCK